MILKRKEFQKLLKEHPTYAHLADVKKIEEEYEWEEREKRERRKEMWNNFKDWLWEWKWIILLVVIMMGFFGTLVFCSITNHTYAMKKKENCISFFQKEYGCKEVLVVDYKEGDQFEMLGCEKWGMCKCGAENTKDCIFVEFPKLQTGDHNGRINQGNQAGN